MDVLLVGLGNRLDEIRALIDSAGYRLRGEFVQRRPRPDPRYFVGKGKLEELKKAVESSAVQAVVVAGELRPSQHFELERALKVQCFDRLRVILEIFTRRASTREAKLQVELAMLQYEVPILREWIHASVAGERPGFMAGGEYRVDSYYETVKRKIVKNRAALRAIRKERALRRDHREERDFRQVSIAGYANAGKSSLFNALSGERVLVDNRPFTTLATTTRSLPNAKRRILLTDTVGLVSNVPLWLVDAFRSTFEEVYASDLVLLLFDVSDAIEDFEEKVLLASSVLLPGASAQSIQPVLAKTDLVDEASVEEAIRILERSVFGRPPVRVSVVVGQSLDELRNLIIREFRYPIEVSIRFSHKDGGPSFLSWLHDHAEVLESSQDSGGVMVRLRCQERDLPEIRARAEIVQGPKTPT